MEEKDSELSSSEKEIRDKKLKQDLDWLMQRLKENSKI